MKKTFTKIMAAIVATTMLAVPLTGCRGNDDWEGYTVGILQHFEHLALDAARDGFISGLADEGFIEGENIRFFRENAIGDHANSAAMATRLVELNPDLLLGISTPSTHALRNATSDIPVVFTAITNPLGAGFVESVERPNTNSTGMSDLVPIIRQFEFMLTILPGTETVAIIYNSGEPNSVVQAEMAVDAARELGLTLIRRTVTSTHDVAQVVTDVAGQVDVIFTPTCNTMAAAMTTAAMSAANAGVPIIAGDSGSVVNGALATYGIDYYDLGRQTAVMAAQILRGETSPQYMPVQWPDADRKEIFINLATTQHLGIEISEEILAVANIVVE